MTLLGAFQKGELNTCIEGVHFFVAYSGWMAGGCLSIELGPAFLCVTERVSWVFLALLLWSAKLYIKFFRRLCPSLRATPVCFLGLSWGWGGVGVVYHFNDKEIPRISIYLLMYWML